jgi:hypothetical protein
MHLDASFIENLESLGLVRLDHGLESRQQSRSVEDASTTLMLQSLLLEQLTSGRKKLRQTVAA